MGENYKARCKKCKRTFQVNIGGGFFFHLLHCDKCGRERSISLTDVDASIKKEHNDIPIHDDKYDKLIEEYVGTCKCGGKFSFEAPPRCPRCRSDRYERIGGTITLYD